MDLASILLEAPSPFADPVVRNLLSAEEYESYDVERLADHIVAFSLASIEGVSSAATAPAKGGQP